jgi:hypothetical protein
MSIQPEKKIMIHQSAKEEKIAINFQDLYKVDPDKIIVDISSVTYSNLAYVQITNRDVYIDFVQMPGIKKDDKMIISASRILMPHTAAKRLAQVLLETLEKSFKDRNMDIYNPSDNPSDEDSQTIDES